MKDIIQKLVEYAIRLGLGGIFGLVLSNCSSVTNLPPAKPNFNGPHLRMADYYYLEPQEIALLETQYLSDPKASQKLWQYYEFYLEDSKNAKRVRKAAERGHHPWAQPHAPNLEYTKGH